jgi:hypothetical protein
MTPTPPPARDDPAYAAAYDAAYATIRRSRRGPHHVAVLDAARFAAFANVPGGGRRIAVAEAASRAAIVDAIAAAEASGTA